MKLAVTAETTIDLTPALLKEFDIKTIPLGITLEGKDMKDGRNVRIRRENGRSAQDQRRQRI